MNSGGAMSTIGACAPNRLLAAAPFASGIASVTA